MTSMIGFNEETIPVFFVRPRSIPGEVVKRQSFARGVRGALELRYRAWR